ncbi:protein pollen defective in guidance 1-like, partial [Trifolium pratense]
VIRVLVPVYAANLPYSPLPWKLFWIMLFSAITYILLTSLKILIGLVLKKHATWIPLLVPEDYIWKQLCPSKF